MGWETRGNRSYYYRKRRVGGRVVSEYVGGGLLGVLAEQLDAEQRAETQAKRQEIQRFDSDDREIIRLCKQLSDAAARMLEAAGFHKHKGQWRKQRMSKNKDKLPAKRPSVEQQCTEAVARADKQDASEADEENLREMIQKHPKQLKCYSNMAILAIRYIIDKIADTPAKQQLLTERYLNLLEDLGYKKSSEVERLLIEQVILSYFRMNITEMNYTQNFHGEEGISLTLGIYYEKRLTAAQHRYLRALGTLARVRKLLGGPAVQFNIAMEGGQQVVANTPLGNEKQPALDRSKPEGKELTDGTPSIRSDDQGTIAKDGRTFRKEAGDNG
ncbi:MAG: hypothetical protein KAT11_00160 [Phycisphaerae bacterium]|nr:hypothetical protein [Phycisphaerae bacterium]